MVRKKRRREKNGPQKATQFILDGVEVPPEKLVRYEKRKEKNKGSNGQQGDTRGFATNRFIELWED